MPHFIRYNLDNVVCLESKFLAWFHAVKKKISNICSVKITGNFQKFQHFISISDLCAIFFVISI